MKKSIKIPDGWYEIPVGTLILSGDFYLIVENEEWQRYEKWDQGGKRVEKYVDASIRRIPRPLKSWKCCEICKKNSGYIKNIREDLSLFLRPSTPCSHGQYYYDENKFHWWSITPSSEDKGYSSW